MVSILAIVCVRNEAFHVERCIRDLIAGGCEVRLIDHASTDGTVERAESFLGRGLLGIEHLPWKGAFSLSEQLRAKRALVEAAVHDWIIHVDADEWLVSPVPAQTLGQAIAAADAEGFNVVNFHECVFIPLPGEDYRRPDYSSHMRDYYFFEPIYPRLNRAWRRDAALDNTLAGGHVVSGEGIRRSPRDLILRHYIVLSQEHAREKYLGRVFSSEDLNKKWHDSRVIDDGKDVRLRTHPAMRRIPDVERHDQFDLSRPVALHFWEWDEEPPAVPRNAQR